MHSRDEQPSIERNQRIKPCITGWHHVLSIIQSLAFEKRDDSCADQCEPGAIRLQRRLVRQCIS